LSGFRAGQEIVGREARQRDLHQAGLSAEQLSHRRVTAVLTFLRDAGLRG